MKRAGLLLIIGVVVGLAVLSVGAVAPVPAPESSEIKQLKKEVETLRQRVDALEERLKEDLLVPAPKEGRRGSPFIIPAPKGGRRAPGFVIPAPGSGQVPPHWKEFEFNGMTYYIVPIDNAHKPAAEVEKQTPPNETPAASQAPDKQ
ncbi:MAG: hypothetical protein M1376_10515 [Planctomycetes bacterium]|nr:hypothetical protein [Planctomycetota bacterium]